MSTRAWMAGGLLAAALMAAGGGCSKKTSDKNLQFVTVVEADELLDGSKGLLKKKTRTCWVDPRVERLYRASHIPGAISLPYQLLATEKYRLDGCDALIVYGNDYNDDLAFAMSKSLIEMGHKEVHTLRGGLRSWEKAGNEVETGAYQP